ncbi:family 2A encapsulin nanocompartment cargo protein cysteine desulfurase [Propionivibrio sp.]|uniref:family 2A encapsulin nanocompartment cargo protein cysteine desulfurase n=1 Tax=Propionivibrio sp. TaxID=2212460 RepID=UPI003BF3E66F
MITPDFLPTGISRLSGPPPGGSALLAGAEAQSAQAAGAPDPSLIAQLANQLFAALPGSASAPTPRQPSFSPALSVAPQVASPAVVTNALPLEPPALPASPLAPDVAPPMGLAPGPNDLRNVPSSLGGALSLVPFFTTAARPPSSSGFYFIDEAATVSAAGKTPFQFGSISVVPELVEQHPNRTPELGFGTFGTTRPFDPRAIRNDFPILREQVNGRPLIWLDNAATTQKPQSVIDRLAYFYAHENSNIHRAAHTLAARATDAYEVAREKVRSFLNAGSADEIIFVRGTTEGINLVAKSWGARHIGAGDEIVISWLEHHANIVPWQQLAAEKGAKLRVAPVDDDGQIILEEYEKLLNARTKIVSISQVSNALGTVTPVREMIQAAHRHGARVLVDGAQSVSHMKADVQALDADFFVFSGHKVFGPTGIGVVYGKQAVLDEMPPWQGGGNMIADVTFEKTLYQPAPAKFEAGTGNIADAVGLGAAIDYVNSIGIENITRYEHELLVYGTRGLQTVPGLRIIGTAKEKAGVLSFVLEGFKTEDVGALLDKEGIAVRSGHHCAQPILRRFGLESTVRPSLAPYNTCEDLDALVSALLRIKGGGGR